MSLLNKPPFLYDKASKRVLNNDKVPVLLLSGYQSLKAATNFPPKLLDKQEDLFGELVAAMLNRKEETL